MRIAFDLDDTLIPGRIPFPLEPLPRNPLRRLWCSERLRLGTTVLFNQLWAMGHEVWIYTSSFRGSFTTKALFRAYDTRVRSVINVPRHLQRMKRLSDQYQRCTKYPPAFRIDLLIDDCLGVALEAQRYHFEVLTVQPDDPDWLGTIRRHLGID